MIDRLCLVVVGILLSCGVALGGEAKFASKPKATRDGKDTKISFAVSAETDVEVAILDAGGNIVRHLAAGVLGKKAPKPLVPGLRQTLTWDGKDDHGAKLSGGNFRVRVSLGMRPVFDKIFGYQPNTLGQRVPGLAVGPGGEAFVLNVARHLHVGFGSPVCQVLDASGKYKRTIMPYRANCFPEKVKDFGILDLGEKGKHPFMPAGHLKSVYPFAGELLYQKPAVASDGRMIICADVKGRGPSLVAVSTRDGGAPEGGALGPLLGKKGLLASACMAASPDGKKVYVSGLGSKNKRQFLPRHAVYAAAWSEKTIKPLIGKPEKPGKGETSLNAPHGVAVDGSGNIYVADRGNNRIAIFSAEGKFKSSLSVEEPYLIDVVAKTGEIFVLAGDPPDRIVKFKDMKQAKPVYEAQVPWVRKRVKGKREKYSVFAAGASAHGAVVWVGAANQWSRFRLLRFAEKGGKLGAPEEKGKGMGLVSCRDIHVDRKREEIFVQNQTSMGTSPMPLMRMNGKTGAIQKTFANKRVSCFTWGADGYFYTVPYPGSTNFCVFRFDRDFKPAPFKGRDSNRTEPVALPHRYSQHMMGRGLAVAHDGTIYMLHETGKGVHQANAISVWEPGGKLRKKRFVSILSQVSLSPRLDPSGNVYIGDPVRPTGQVVPPEMQGKVDTAKVKWYSKFCSNAYPLMYGSILKFGPKGGEGIGKGVAGKKAIVAYDLAVGVDGPLWSYFGVGPIPATHGPYGHYVLGACSCESMRFDVDGWGRVFAPDAGRFRVVMLDTAGNKIGSFGAYANQDSYGPKSPVPTSHVPLGFPICAGVSDRAVYVGDILNRRLVRVKLAYAAQETCAVR